MLEQMLAFLLSIFANPNLAGIGLAVAFGVIWLACYRPPLLKNPWLWAVLGGGAILMPLSVVLAQIPLKASISLLYSQFWSGATIAQWSLLVAVPFFLLSALVQEGAKLVPPVVYWRREGKNISPTLGVVLGALAGAGFGILWVQWLHNATYASGWTWTNVQTGGITQLAPFLEGFFLVAFHTAACALAGYGLARGWGWQFYLLASFLHAAIDYTYLLQRGHYVTDFQALMIIGAWAFLTTGAALWLRETKPTPAEPAPEAKK